MSQTDSSLENYSKSILNGLNGMMGILDKKINDFMSTATQEQKEQLQKDLSNSNIKEQIEKIKAGNGNS